MAYSLEQSTSFSITTGSQEIRLNLKSFNISVSDSIYSLAPRLVMTTEDVSGIGLESRLNVLGQNIAFKMISGGQEINFPMTCAVYETPKADSMNGLSGTFRIEFRHTAEFSGKESSGYENRSPSEVFEAAMAQMNNEFNSLTGNSMRLPVLNTVKTSRCTSYPLILNPNYTLKDLVDKILLPLANDGSAATSPYYGYISIENVAMFESLKDMMDKAPSCTIVFGHPLDDRENATVALSLNNFSQDYSRVYGFIDQSLSYLDENHEVRSQDISLSNVVTPLALMKNSSRTNLVHPSDFYDTTDPVKEAGINMFKNRKGLLFEKLVVLVFMDLSLCAGKTVDLDVYLNTADSEKSENYSGRYVIESSEHLWDAGSMTGYTRLILGRMSMQIKGREMHQ